MKKSQIGVLCVIITTLICFQMMITAVSGQTVSWVSTFGGSKTEYVIDATPSRTDLGAYVTGHYISNPFNFANKKIDTQSASVFDLFLGKVNNSGLAEWAINLVGSGNDNVAQVLETKDGYLYLAGTFESKFYFNSTFFLDTKGFSKHSYLAKYTNKGDFLWAVASEGDFSFDSVYGAAIAKDGGVYVSGEFQGTVNFQNFELKAIGSNDFYLVKFSKTGKVKWAKSGGAAQNDRAYDVSVAKDGGAYITGTVQGDQAKFSEDLTLSSTNKGEGIFIAKYSRRGKVQWARFFGGFDGEYANSVETASDGGALIAGYFQSFALTFANDVSVNRIGSQPSFVAKYNATGSVEWVFVIGKSDSSTIQSLSATSDGGFYTSGVFDGTIEFNGKLPLTRVTGAKTNSFVAKFDRHGVVEWAKQFGTTGDTWALSIAGSPDRGVLVGGNYDRKITIDGVSYTPYSTSPDGILIKVLCDTCVGTYCYGYLSNETEVCSGRGNCTADNTCACPEGYAGDECDEPICFNIPKLSDMSCSDNGDCISPDTCSCYKGYTGVDCAIPICYNVSSVDANVCSGSGNCTEPDTCSCSQGYTGNNCELYICYGRNSSDPKVCSGRGSCVNPNVCVCQDHYFGNNCSVTTCSGVHSNTSQVCSDNGVCIAYDNCTCDAGYDEADCSNYYCYGTKVSDKGVCSGNGVCSSPNSCKCNKGYGGKSCDINVCFGIEATETDVCSSKGKCISPDQCQCDSGYSGEKCDVFSCFSVPSGNTTVCSSHGTCTALDVCKCETEYHGANCGYYTCYGQGNNETNVCNGNKCVGHDDCQCSKEGYFDDCSVTTCNGVRSDLIKDVCSGRGTCIDFNTCNCVESKGLNCEIPQCYGYYQNEAKVCSGKGDCVAPSTCDCDAGYIGDKCDFFTCYGKNNSAADACSGHGSCTGVDQCSCDFSASKGFYAGNNCEKCDSGYSGDDCKKKTCQPATTCSGKGVCDLNQDCVCSNEGTTGFYTGIHCDKCQQNYYGPECKVFCGETETCSNHGTCRNNGTCQCFSSPDNGFYKNDDCGVCDDAYGDGCKTLAPGVFKFNDDGISISGKWVVPQAQGTVKCSTFFLANTVSKLGKDPLCGYKTEDDKQNGRFSIVLGKQPTINPGDNLEFNLLYTTTNVQKFVVVVGNPVNPPNPLVVVRAPAKISECDGITIDASDSKSPDSRPLKFEWLAVDGGNATQLDDYLKDYNSSIATIPSEYLTAGSTYTILLFVTNIFGEMEEATIEFTKGDSFLPVVYFNGPARQRTYRDSFFRLDVSTTYSDCSDSEVLEFSFEQLTGEKLNYRVAEQSLLYDPFTFPAIAAEYKFKVKVHPKFRPEDYTTASVIVEVALNPLVASVVGGRKSVASSAKVVLDASRSKDPDNSPETAQFYWQCTDTVNIICPQSLLQSVSKEKTSVLTLDGIPAGSYEFTVTYSKGSRNATASTTVLSIEAQNGVNYPTIEFDPELASKRSLVPDSAPYIFTVKITDADSVTVLFDGDDIQLSNDWIAERAGSELVINYNAVPTYGQHVLRIETIVNGITIFSEYGFDMGPPPPVPGSISIPAKVDMLTEVNFVATQWNLADCEDIEVCKTQLSYQWLIKDQNQKELLRTDKSKSNYITIPGLPPGDFIVDVVVYNEAGASASLDSSITVQVVSPCASLYTSSLEKLLTMTSFADSSAANLLTFALSKSISTCFQSRTTRASSVTQILLEQLQKRFNAIDAATPFSDAFYGEYGSTIQNILDVNNIDDSSVQLALEILKTIIQSMSKAANSEKIKPKTADIYFNSLNKILQKSRSLSSSVSQAVSELMGQLTRSSLYQRVLQPKQYSGYTIAFGTFPLSSLDKRREVPKVLDSGFAETTSFTFPSEIKTALALPSVQIQVQVFSKENNPKSYGGNNNAGVGSTSLVSAIVSLEVKKLDASPINVTGVLTTIAIPATVNVGQLRQKTSEDGYVLYCRYHDENELKWVKDGSCTVESFSSTQVTIRTSHLSMFAITEDYVKGISDDVPADEGKDNQPVRIGVGIGIGVGVPVVLLILLVIIITVVVCCICLIRKSKEEPRDYELQDMVNL